MLMFIECIVWHLKTVEMMFIEKIGLSIEKDVRHVDSKQTTTQVTGCDTYANLRTSWKQEVVMLG